MSSRSPELFDLTDRVAIVTGAAGLLGMQHVRVLARFGAIVIMCDVDHVNCRKYAREIGSELGVKCSSIELDVTQPDSVLNMVESVMDMYGRIDILINNAADKSTNFFSPYEEFPLEDWNHVIAVNLTGMFLCSQAAGKIMLKQGKGNIVNILSIYGIVGPDQRIYEGTGINTPAVYSTSKAGALGLTRYLATYWAESGIRVNAISPGGIYDEHQEPFLSKYSERVPLGRMGKQSELQGALLFLTSDASSYVTGQNIVVDGGWTAW